MRKVELLAPAGDKDAFVAAIKSGANAIYLGGKFSARKFAPNFDIETLKWAVEYAHLRDVRVFVTVNIMFYESELKGLFDYLDELYLIDVDAFIIQDLGLIPYIKQRYPDIEIHVSTQSTVSNKYAAKQLQDLGVHRVVLARENTIEEIKAICDYVDIDIEVFCHGALCVCYSGQCLMSSSIGKRSGNRGECAQPCRLRYKLYEDDKVIDDRFLLSPKDLMTLEHIDDLIESGMYSFKVEGRMKSPEYVQSTIRAYRKAIDAYYAKKHVDFYEEIDIIKRTFNRSYTTGYIFHDKYIVDGLRSGNRGIYIGDVVSYNNKSKRVSIKLSDTLRQDDSILFESIDKGRPVNKIYLNGKLVNTANKNDIVDIEFNEFVKKGKVHKVKDVEVSKFLSNELNKAKPQVPISIDFSCYIGTQPTLTIHYKDISVDSSIDYIIEQAVEHCTTIERIREQLSKTGNTSFYVSKVNVYGDEDINIPIKLLNELRRGALKLLEKEILTSYRTHIDPYSNTINNYPTSNPLKYVKITNREQLNVVINYPFNFIFVPYCRDVMEFYNLFDNKERFVLYIDRCLRDKELEEILKSHIYKLVNTVCVNDLGALYLCKGKQIILGQGIVNYNHLDLEFYNDHKVILSSEITKNEFNTISNAQSILQVYGKVENMIMEYCPISKCKNKGQLIKHCNQCKGHSYYTTDRMNVRNDLILDEYCRVHILNSKSLYLDNVDMNKQHVYFSFTNESIDEVKSVIELLLFQNEHYNFEKSKKTYGYYR